MYFHCRHSFLSTGPRQVDGRPSHTISAIQIGKVKDIGRATLRVAVGAAADGGLALLKGREAKNQRNERCENDDRFHVDR